MEMGKDVTSCMHILKLLKYLETILHLFFFIVDRILLEQLMAHMLSINYHKSNTIYWTKRISKEESKMDFFFLINMPYFHFIDTQKGMCLQL